MPTTLAIYQLDWTNPKHAKILAELEDDEERSDYAAGFDQNDIEQEDEFQLELWVEDGGRFPFIRQYGTNKPARRVSTVGECTRLVHIP